eukprot:scaffold67458_cov36-Phaeocystis_antarctica.AAC.1
METERVELRSDDRAPRIHCHADSRVTTCLCLQVPGRRAPVAARGTPRARAASPVAYWPHAGYRPAHGAR